MISKASALPSICTAECQTIAEVSEDPTGSWEQPVTSPAPVHHLPRRKQHWKLITPRWKIRVASKKVLCPSGGFWCGHELLTGRSRGHRVGGKVVEEVEKEGYRHMGEIPEISKTAEVGAAAHKAHKMHTRNPKAWRTHLTKLIYMCSFPPCLSTLNLFFFTLCRMGCSHLTMVAHVYVMPLLLETPRANWSLRNMGMETNKSQENPPETL